MSNKLTQTQVYFWSLQRIVLKKILTVKAIFLKYNYISLLQIYLQNLEIACEALMPFNKCIDKHMKNKEDTTVNRSTLHSKAGAVLLVLCVCVPQCV